MTSNQNNAVYTHGYKTSNFAGIDARTAQSHANWLLPHLEPGMRVLDVGPGPGTITIGLAEAVAPGEVTGVELGEAYVELANENARDAGLNNLKVIQGDALDLPFDDNSIDVVFSFAVLEHIPDPPEALAEFYRVLKPGGLVAVGSGAVSLHAHPFDSPLGSENLHFFVKIWKSNGGHPDLGREQPRLVSSAGFTNITIGGFYEEENGAHKLADTFPQLLRDPETVRKAEELGVATKTEIARAVDEIASISDDPTAWHFLAWLWALGRKPS
jgi:ubiquinone/menaquinone biosynthesis C-methylase UbiE